MYAEVERIVDYYPGWTPDYVKSLSVRERRHWAARVKDKSGN